MEEFYPSEIARLVLGYLEEVKCTNSWHTFLEESDDLREHCSLYKKGKNCTTSVRGESLLDILKAYCVLKSFYENILCQNTWKVVLDDIIYLQDHYQLYKRKTCYSTEKTGQSIINALKEWILKIPCDNNSRSDYSQNVSANPANSSSQQSDNIRNCNSSYYPHSLTSLKSNILKNVPTDIPSARSLQANDKIIQTDRFLSFQLQNSVTDSTTQQLPCVLETGTGCSPHSDGISSVSDKGAVQNESDPPNSIHLLERQSSEVSTNWDSSEEYSMATLSYVRSQILPYITPRKDTENIIDNKESPERIGSVVRKILSESFLTKSIQLPDTPFKWENLGNASMEEFAGCSEELSKLVKFLSDNENSDNAPCEDFSADSSTSKSHSPTCNNNDDSQNLLSNLCKMDKKSNEEYTDKTQHSLNISESNNQIKANSETDNLTSKIPTSHQVMLNDSTVPSKCSDVSEIHEMEEINSNDSNEVNTCNKSSEPTNELSRPYNDYVHSNSPDTENTHNYEITSDVHQSNKTKSSITIMDNCIQNTKSSPETGLSNDFSNCKSAIGSQNLDQNSAQVEVNKNFHVYTTNVTEALSSADLAYQATKNSATESLNIEIIDENDITNSKVEAQAKEINCQNTVEQLKEVGNVQNLDQNSAQVEVNKNFHVECTTNVTEALSSADLAYQATKNSATESLNIEVVDENDITNSKVETQAKEINCQNTVEQLKEVDNFEVNQNADVDTNQNAVAQTQKSLNDISFAQTQPHHSAITPITDQPNTVLPFSTVPALIVPNLSANNEVENNIQYRIILNNPYGWNAPVVNGLPFVPSLPVSSVSNQTVFAPTPAAVLTNIDTIASDYSINTSSSLQKTKKLATSVASPSNKSIGVSFQDTSKQITSASPQSKSALQSAKKVAKKKDSKPKPILKEQKKEGEKSTSSTTKRVYTQRLPKRKLLRIFPLTPKKKEAVPSSKSSDNNIPVLSISESPNNSGNTSKVISKITNEFEEQCKGQVFNLLMAESKKLSGKSGLADSSHVRNLNFNSKSLGLELVDERKELQKINDDIQHSENKCETQGKSDTQNMNKRNVNQKENVMQNKDKKKKSCKQNKKNSLNRRNKTLNKVQNNDKKTRAPSRKNTKVQSKKNKSQENSVISISDEKIKLQKKGKICNKKNISQKRDELTVNAKNKSSGSKNNVQNKKDSALTSNEVLHDNVKKISQEQNKLQSSYENSKLAANDEKNEPQCENNVEPTNDGKTRSQEYNETPIKNKISKLQGRNRVLFNDKITELPVSDKKTSSKDYSQKHINATNNELCKENKNFSNRTNKLHINNEVSVNDRNNEPHKEQSSDKKNGSPVYNEMVIFEETNKLQGEINTVKNKKTKLQGSDYVSVNDKKKKSPKKSNTIQSRGANYKSKKESNKVQRSVEKNKLLKINEMPFYDINDTSQESNEMTFSNKKNKSKDNNKLIVGDAKDKSQWSSGMLENDKKSKSENKIDEEIKLVEYNKMPVIDKNSKLQKEIDEQSNDKNKAFEDHNERQTYHNYNYLLVNNAEEPILIKQSQIIEQFQEKTKDSEPISKCVDSTTPEKQMQGNVLEANYDPPPVTRKRKMAHPKKWIKPDFDASTVDFIMALQDTMKNETQRTVSDMSDNFEPSFSMAASILDHIEVSKNPTVCVKDSCAKLNYSKKSNASDLSKIASTSSLLTNENCASQEVLDVSKNGEVIDLTDSKKEILNKYEAANLSTKNLFSNTSDNKAQPAKQKVKHIKKSTGSHVKNLLVSVRPHYQRTVTKLPREIVQLKRIFFKRKAVNPSDGVLDSELSKNIFPNSLTGMPGTEVVKENAGHMVSPESNCQCHLLKANESYSVINKSLNIANSNEESTDEISTRKENLSECNSFTSSVSNSVLTKSHNKSTTNTFQEDVHSLVREKSIIKEKNSPDILESFPSKESGNNENSSFPLKTQNMLIDSKRCEANNNSKIKRHSRHLASAALKKTDINNDSLLDELSETEINVLPKIKKTASSQKSFKNKVKRGSTFSINRTTKTSGFKRPKGLILSEIYKEGNIKSSFSDCKTLKTYSKHSFSPKNVPNESENVTSNVNHKHFEDEHMPCSIINRKRKCNEHFSDTGKSPKKIAICSPLATKGRKCRKISPSSIEVNILSPERSFKSDEEVSSSHSNGEEHLLFTESTQTLSLQLSNRDAIHEDHIGNSLIQNSDIKSENIRDSPIKCTHKTRKITHKTALSKKIEEDPNMPAGVKLPSTWNNKKLIYYSDEIRQSAKNGKKKGKRNIPTGTKGKQNRASKRGKSLKSTKQKINYNKQSFQQKSISENIQETNITTGKNILCDSMPTNSKHHDLISKEKVIKISKGERKELTHSVASSEEEFLKSESDQGSTKDPLTLPPEKDSSEIHGSSSKSIVQQLESCEHIQSLIEKFGVDYLLNKLDTVIQS